MNDAETGFEEYIEYLASLRKDHLEYFLEGGQAVNYWAEFVDAKIKERPLSPLRPFTSKDCDIWVSNGTWRVLKRNPAMRKGSSPSDGQLGIITLSEEPPRVVDVLSSVYGIPRCEYARLMVRALDDGTVRVIDPVYLFLSKCHCFLHLPQADRQDERHVRMMALILPEYLTLRIEDTEANAEGAQTDKNLINEIKLLKKISSSGPCRNAMQRLELNPSSLIPWERLAQSTCERLRKYGNSQIDRSN